MGSEAVLVGAAILALTFFLDLLELTYARIAWFVRTLRFWLYFILHLLISFLAAYMLRAAVTEWYVLAPAAVFLGVGVVSNTNVRVGGYSLVPIADVFVSIKTRMIEQAAEDKALEVVRAKLIERLSKLSIERIAIVHEAGLLGANVSQEKVLRMAQRAAAAGGRQKAMLITQLLKANPVYVEQNIDAWEAAVGP